VKNKPQIKLNNAMQNNVQPKTGCVEDSAPPKIRRKSSLTLAPMSDTAIFPNAAQERTASPKKLIGKTNLEYRVVISA
jgi:hypothetical protein